MTRINFPLWVLGVVVAITAAVAQTGIPIVTPDEASADGGPQPPLLAFHFDGDTEGWISPDQISVAAVTTRQEHVQAGGGALEFTYLLPRPESIQDGKMPPVLTAPLQADLREARALRFWLQTDQPAVILLFLSEADGSNYNVPLYSPAETWQHVALSLDRFVLDDESTDENDQLDPDQINALGVLDASFFLSLLTQQPVAEEDRQFWVDEFEILPSEVPSSYGLDREEIDYVVVDDFESGFLPWVPLRGELSLEEDHPTALPGQHAMRWAHEGPAGPIVALIRPFRLPPMEGFTQLHLWVKSSVATTLAVSFEEMPDRTGDESSYHHPFPVQPGEWEEVVLPLNQFTLDQEKKDDNHQFDLNEVKTMYIVDAGAVFGQTDGAEIWVDGIVLE